MTRRVGKLLMAVGLLLTSVLVISPAEAHSRCAYHFYDAACVSGDGTHRSWTVCDHEADGHGVWGWVQTRLGHQHTGYDSNGSKDPCYSYSVPSWDPSPITDIWVCENGSSCSNTVVA